MNPELTRYGRTIPEVLDHMGSEEPAFLVLNIAAIILDRGSGSQPAPDLLPEHERNAYAVSEMMSEVGCGGFKSFFSGSSGLYVGCLIPALEAVGSREFLDIAKRALSIFGETPLDNRARWQRIEDLTHDGEIDVWADCDEAFYECEEPLDLLVLQYLKGCV